MEIIVNEYNDINLIVELDSVVQNLKEIFSELDRKGSTQGQKYDLEKAKDKYFEELNELLPKLTEGKNGLYGEYFVRQARPRYMEK